MNLKMSLFCGCLLLAVSSTALAMPLYVVVSNNLKGVSFSAIEVKHILLGEVASIRNSRVHLIYPSYSSPAIEVLSQFLGKGKGTRNLKSYWSKMIFTGRATPPNTASDDSELRRLISEDNSVGVATTAGGFNVVFTIHG